MSVKIDRELINKIIEGTCSDKELADFLQQVRTMDKDSFLATYHWLYQEIGNYPPEALNTGFKERLEQRLDALEVTPMRHKWRKYMAAAAVLVLLLGTGAWLLFSGKKRNEVMATTAGEQRFKNDVAPGHQGAILTLSSGRSIVLDSAGNGSVASDKGIQVIKKDGEINYSGKTGETVYNNITTPKGRQWQLTLSDGTQVWLNAFSSIRYPLVFIGKEREVEITGEAYFEVARDKTKPFKVKINPASGKGAEVEVIGTHFDISSYEDEKTIKTTLLEGSIKVSAGNQRPVILAAGQQVRIGGDGLLNVHSDADMEETIAWKNGRFLLNTDLETVMRQIAKWYDVDIVYQDRIKDPYSIDIPRNIPLSSLLKYMEMSGGVHFGINGKQVIVKK